MFDFIKKFYNKLFKIEKSVSVSSYPNIFNHNNNDIDLSVISLVLDGAGSAITTGVKADILIPYDCTIVLSTLATDVAGTISVDIWIDTFDHFPPTVDDSKLTPSIAIAGTTYQSSALSIAIVANSIVRFNVDACDTITRCLVALNIIK